MPDTPGRDAYAARQARKKKFLASFHPSPSLRDKAAVSSIFLPPALTGGGAKPAKGGKSIRPGQLAVERRRLSLGVEKDPTAWQRQPDNDVRAAPKPKPAATRIPGYGGRGFQLDKSRLPYTGQMPRGGGFVRSVGNATVDFARSAARDLIGAAWTGQKRGHLAAAAEVADRPVSIGKSVVKTSAEWGLGPNLTAAIQGEDANPYWAIAEGMMTLPFLRGAAASRMAIRAALKGEKAGPEFSRAFEASTPLITAGKRFSKAPQKLKNIHVRTFDVGDGLQVVIPAARSRSGRAAVSVWDRLRVGTEKTGLVKPEEAKAGTEFRHSIAMRQQQKNVPGMALKASLRELDDDQVYAVRLAAERVPAEERIAAHKEWARDAQRPEEAVYHAIHADLLTKASKWVTVGDDGLATLAPNAPPKMREAYEYLQQTAAEREGIYAELGRLSDEQAANRIFAIGRVFRGARWRETEDLIEEALDKHPGRRALFEAIDQVVPNAELRSANKALMDARARHMAEEAGQPENVDLFYGPIQAEFHAEQFVPEHVIKADDELDILLQDTTPLPLQELPEQLDWTALRLAAEGKTVPKNMQTPEGFQEAIERVYSYVKAGQQYRHWYDVAGRNIREFGFILGIEPAKMSKLVAIYSQAAMPTENMRRAMVAALEWKETGTVKSKLLGGEPQRAKAQQVLSGEGDWQGIKTNSFHANLLESIDPRLYKQLYGDTPIVTNDRWVAEMFDPGLEKRIPPGLYDTLTDIYVEIGRQLGWTPKEVQAAAWVTAKSKGTVKTMEARGKTPKHWSEYMESSSDAYGRALDRYFPDRPEFVNKLFQLDDDVQYRMDQIAGNDLDDLPTSVKFGGKEYTWHSSGELQQIAHEYMQQAGLDYLPPTRYIPADPEKAKAIAAAYERMQHAPQDPMVAASYQAFKEETMAQYETLIRAGYKPEFYPEGADPYPLSPRQSAFDVAAQKHMYVFPTESGFGDDFAETAAQFPNHPMMEKTGLLWNGKEVYYNDVFRFVHDVFGHAKEGVGFRASGEDNAWRSHAAMYSRKARNAMTAETRGQNSWVNHGPHGETNRTASQTETVYADQKAGRLPGWIEDDLDPPATGGVIGGAPGTIGGWEAGRAIEDIPTIEGELPSKAFISDNYGPPNPELQEFHGSLMDEVNERAAELQRQADARDYFFEVGDHVTSKAGRNFEILRRGPGQEYLVRDLDHGHEYVVPERAFDKPPKMETESGMTPLEEFVELPPDAQMLTKGEAYMMDADPQFVYHGTDDVTAEKIMAERFIRPGGPLGGVGDVAWVADNPALAATHAGKAAYAAGNPEGGTVIAIPRSAIPASAVKHGGEAGRYGGTTWASKEGYLFDVVGGEGGRARGLIIFDPKGATIHLSESASTSTIQHEVAHLVRRMTQGSAHERHVGAWAGAKWDAKTKSYTWDREAEEKYARGVESFLRTGRGPAPVANAVKAISHELRDEWRLKELPDLPPNVADAMARLLSFSKQKGGRLVGAEDFVLQADTLPIYTPYDRGFPISLKRPGKAISTYLRNATTLFGGGRAAIGKGPDDAALRKSFTGSLLLSGMFNPGLEASTKSLMTATRLSAAHRVRGELLKASTELPRDVTDYAIKVDPKKTTSPALKALWERLDTLEVEGGRLTEKELEDIDFNVIEQLREDLFPGAVDEVPLHAVALKALQDAEPVPNIRWVSREFLDETGVLYQPTGRTQIGVPTRLAKAKKMGYLSVDTINDVQKALVLYASPAYAPVQLVGNLGMNLIQQGVFMPRNVWQATLLHHQLDRFERIALDTLMGRGATEAFDLRSTPGQMINGTIGHWINRAVDTVPRRAAFLHEAHKLGITGDGLKAMLRDQSEDALQLKDYLSRKAQDAIVNFDRMSPFERDVIARWIFFYPWLRGATRYSARFVLDHPVQAMAIAMAADYAWDESDAQLGERPAFAEDTFPISTKSVGLSLPFSDKGVGLDDVVGDKTWTSGGNPMTISARQLFTMTTPLDLARAGLGFVEGDPTSTGILESLSPVPYAAIVAGIGYDPFLEKKVDRGPKTFLGQVTQIPSKDRMEKIRMSDEEREGRKERALFPRTEGQEWMRLFGGGLAPTPYNREVGESMATPDGQASPETKTKEKTQELMDDLDSVAKAAGVQVPPEIRRQGQMLAQLDANPQRMTEDDDPENDRRYDYEERLATIIDLYAQVSPGDAARIRRESAGAKGDVAKEWYLDLREEMFQDYRDFINEYDQEE